MRRLTWLALLSVAIVATALYYTQKVYATPNNDHHGTCSVASLKGTYAFRRSGVNNVLGSPIAEIGINVLNGDGTILFIRNTKSSNGVIRDWTDEPAPIGSYTVDPDCTGTFCGAGNDCHGRGNEARRGGLRERRGARHVRCLIAVERQLLRELPATTELRLLADQRPSVAALLPLTGQGLTPIRRTVGPSAD